AALLSRREPLQHLAVPVRRVGIVVVGLDREVTAREVEAGGRFETRVRVEHRVGRPEADRARFELGEQSATEPLAATGRLDPQVLDLEPHLAIGARLDAPNAAAAD